VTGTVATLTWTEPADLDNAHDALRRARMQHWWASNEFGITRLSHRPRMRAIAQQLCDHLAGRAEDGAVEFISAFADPYPAWVLREFMGLSHQPGRGGRVAGGHRRGVSAPLPARR
jgi:hypothetical protein